MNILFITHYQELYGANRSLLNLLVNLDKSKYTPLVICPWTGDFTNELNSHGIKNISGHYFCVLAYKTTKGFIKKPFQILKTFYMLSLIFKAVQNFNPDIIYSNSSIIWIGNMLSYVLNKPHIVHIREFGRQDYGYKIFGGDKLFNYLLSASDAVISISKEIEKVVLLSENLEPKRKYQIYNGIVNDIEIVCTPKKIQQRDAVVFCMVGLLISSKGFLEALKAMEIIVKDYPDTKLIICGKGLPNDDYESKLHRAAQDLTLKDQVVFTGYLDDVKPVYTQSDCLLMCSKAEGLGRVTIEAMANGLPVIGHKSGATPEIVAENFNGYLYDNEEIELASCMKEIIEGGNYETLSEGAIYTVRKYFTIEEYTKTVEAVFTHLV